MSQKPLPKETRDQVARGLRASGGEQAIPPLLALIEKDDDPDPKNPQQTDTLVDQLAELNGKPEPSGLDFRHLGERDGSSPRPCAPGRATPRLAKLARAGNLRAMQVLAHSNDELARAPLQDLARTATGHALHVALDGLERFWAASSVDLFARGLGDPEADVVKTAVQGLRKSKDTRAPALIAPLLRHADKSVRQAAVAGLSDLKITVPTLPVIADTLLNETNDAIAATLADVLIRAGWRDTAAIKPLGVKLEAASEYQGYGYLRLLRHLSRDAMGPATDNEFYRDQKGWTARWVSWAREH
jgi:HEAT repeat protein